MRLPSPKVMANVLAGLAILAMLASISPGIDFQLMARDLSAPPMGQAAAHQNPAR